MANKPIWQQIEEDTNSFEQVLLLTSKFISVKPKYLSYTRAIEQAYKAHKPFTLKEWQTLHDIAIALWYQQYSSSSHSFKFEDLSAQFLPKYQQIINLLLKKSTQLTQLQDISFLRENSLKIWQEFMARLCFISYEEKQAGKKPKKVRLDPDTQFAFFGAAALTIAIGAAILVVKLRR
ncbi:LPXTG cell wall anchor domain-containing protein [Ancylothrix sp. C2]|uniref:LPXTG cell wall anchor domain-containing protein n=1 Tax=Ancylothrix sp. D3o TaxID=2953691 RepID=UPI0021BAD668|nr:LPXTG cell wall anchor domain-containing protein [Ancylothrix sp. D3o]MCT7948425.1 LPXTG cell wall anchor domain-containing protein [Ancylothrix sp. D3o]